MIDSVSMWPELVATEDCGAEAVVQAIFDNIIARHGMPRGISILSDNGSAFISKLTAEFCKRFRLSICSLHRIIHNQIVVQKNLQILFINH